MMQGVTKTAAGFTRRGFLVALGASGLAIWIAAQPCRGASGMVEDRGEGLTPNTRITIAMMER